MNEVTKIKTLEGSILNRTLEANEEELRVVPVEVVSQIIDYFHTKPFSESNELIIALDSTMNQKSYVALMDKKLAEKN